MSQDEIRTGRAHLHGLSFSLEANGFLDDAIAFAQDPGMRTIYLNGQYVPEAEGKISVFDRGFLFSDSVYEVVSVLDGRLVDFDGHVRRLDRKSVV